MKWILKNTVLTVTLFTLFFSLGEKTSMALEEPSFTVLEKLETIEIRNYAPYLVAETEVQGNREQSGAEGFKRLAAYIFGKNQGNHSIAMTAPVAQTQNTTLAMTAPVMQQAVGKEAKAPSSSPGGVQSWTIQFMIPSRYTLQTVPQPTDARISLKQVLGKKMAAIRYSGRWTESNYHEHLQILVDALQKKQLKTRGEPTWARYNPPFTPWFLRRNEILFELE